MKIRIRIFAALLALLTVLPIVSCTTDGTETVTPPVVTEEDLSSFAGSVTEPDTEPYTEPDTTIPATTEEPAPVTDEETTAPVTEEETTVTETETTTDEET
ncbi:MAG: hypothetical protein J5585_05850, partial [Clostridia bacterium]|nr:hypothetical protein [Clostridia bacterium]